MSSCDNESRMRYLLSNISNIAVRVRRQYRPDDIDIITQMVIEIGELRRSALISEDDTTLLEARNIITHMLNGILHK